MRLTRRWLFGLFGGAAASRVLPEVSDWKKAAAAPTEVAVSRMTFFDLAGNLVGGADAFPMGAARNGSVTLQGTADIPGGTTVGSLRVETRLGDQVVYTSERMELAPEYFVARGTMTGMVPLSLTGVEHEPQPRTEWEQVRDELGWDGPPAGWTDPEDEDEDEDYEWA